MKIKNKQTEKKHPKRQQATQKRHTAQKKKKTLVKKVPLCSLGKGNFVKEK